MELKELKSAGFFKKKYYIGDLFFDEEGKPFEKESLSITLREPTSSDMSRLTDDAKTNQKLFMEWIPKYIIAQDGFENEGTPAPCKEVGELIVSQTNAFFTLMTEWSDDLPLIKKSREKSKERENPSSSETK
jgi:hypothetical protein